MGNIKIEKMVLGMVQTNTWFVINEKTKELILIDPADDAGRIIRKIEADGLKLQGFCSRMVILIISVRWMI